MSFEQQLLTERRITRWQLQEIRKMFDMTDADGSGEVSPSDLGVMLQKICKGRRLLLFFRNTDRIPRLVGRVKENRLC